MAVVLLACAQGETAPFGDGGAGGDGGAPGVTTGGSTTGKGATTSGSSTTGTTSTTSTTSTTGPTTTSTTTTTTTTATTTVSTTTGMMGCGPLEIDCGDGTCFDFFALCDGFQDCSNGFDEDPVLCTSGVPPEWTCPTGYYNAADGCDCGCGAYDPDCPNATSAVCEYCTSGCAMTSCPGNIDPNNNAICI